MILRRKLILRFLILALGIVLPLALLYGSDMKPKGNLPLWLPSRSAGKRMIHSPEPKYPVLARINHIQGAVRLELVIDESGNVSRIRVRKGHPFLAIAALEAVRQWRYKPLELEGRAREVRTVALVNFKLRSRKIIKNYLTPARAEKDLISRVTPPALLAPTHPGMNGEAGPVGNQQSVRVRVLLDKKGRVVDGHFMSAGRGNLSRVLEQLAEWKFKPAYFGTLPVPWYMEVDVPLAAREQDSSAAAGG